MFQKVSRWKEFAKILKHHKIFAGAAVGWPHHTIATLFSWNGGRRRSWNQLTSRRSNFLKLRTSHLGKWTYLRKGCSCRHQNRPKVPFYMQVMIFLGITLFLPRTAKTPLRKVTSDDNFDVGILIFRISTIRARGYVMKLRTSGILESIDSREEWFLKLRTHIFEMKLPSKGVYMPRSKSPESTVSHAEYGIPRHYFFFIGPEKHPWGR